MNTQPDPIKHVVLLMLENHSFDEMLGCFQDTYADLDGVRSVEPRYNLTLKGDKITQTPKQNYFMRFDPRHEKAHVLEQIKDGNSGFVRDFATAYPKSTKEDYAQLMGYYPMGFLPALHNLAKDFTICDRWFSSLPGPTWPNRYFALSGTSSGYVEMPEGMKEMHLDTLEAQTQPTIFDRLNEKNRTWKIYYYDFPNSLSFAKQRGNPKNLANYYKIDDFFNQDSKDAASFPEFVFIEPKYFGIDQNDDHPPHNVMKAEKLIADVYNAIRSNTELWNETLLVVAFDEHGGFYDHVTPPAAVPPDDKKQEYDFTQLGVRVPALLISPWIGRRVHHTIYDHTSVLKYLTDKWQLGPLGARTARANSIADAITERTPRTDTIGFIRVPFSELIKSDGAAAQQTATGHQGAIHVLAEYIRHEMQGIESPLFGDSVTLAARTSRVGVDITAWLGRGIQWLGNKLAALGDRAQNRQITRTTDVADQQIEIGKQLAG